MKKQCKPRIFISVHFFTLFILLYYFSIRSLWFGISRYTIPAMPFILLAVIVFCSFATTLCFINKTYPVCLAIPVFFIDCFFLIINSFICSVILYALPYFIREFFYGVFYLLLLWILYFAIVRLPKLRFFQKKWFPSLILTLLLTVGFLLHFRIPFYNSISSVPVVYAVGNTYQIVFTSHAKGTGWVTIDGVDYSDTYAGYQRSETNVHKITVPMAALDGTGEYTISTSSMLFRSLYGVIQGKTYQKTYQWKGLTPEDGLQYYVLSDTHNTQKTPAAAASYFGDALDLLICCGDAASWVDRESDLTQTLRLAGAITGGRVPVIYARGNHETKGLQAHQLYRYVSADEENFYYTFRIKNVWGIVLDIGEDHGDRYPDYCGTAKFNAYRRAQTAFLDEVLENAQKEFDAPGVDYRIGVCHIPLTIKYSNDHAAAYKDAWIRRLNKMKLTVLFSGHVHQLWYIDDRFEDGATLTLASHYRDGKKDSSSRIMTNAKFPSILVSRRSKGQSLSYPEEPFDTAFIGLAVTADKFKTTMKYTTEKGAVLDNIVCPWYENIEYGSEITIQNKKE